MAKKAFEPYNLGCPKCHSQNSLFGTIASGKPYNQCYICGLGHAPGTLLMSLEKQITGKFVNNFIMEDDE